MSKYQIVSKGNKQAIFDDKGNQISQWWNEVWFSDLDKTGYYFVKNEDNKTAIFHTSNPYEPVTLWWDAIYTYGLTEGTSDYYIVTYIDDNVDEDEEKYKQAIYHINDKYTPISKWWYQVFDSGLVNGESEFYIAADIIDGEIYEAVFHINNPYEPVTRWWYEIESNGFVRGQSPFYIVKNDECKEAIFHIDNHNEPITKWYNAVWSEGLVEGSSKQYYIAINEKGQFTILSVNDPNRPIAIFDKASDAIEKLKELIKQEKLKDNT